MFRDKDNTYSLLLTIVLNFDNKKRYYELDYTNISGLFIAVFGSIGSIKIIFSILCNFVNKKLYLIQIA